MPDLPVLLKEGSVKDIYTDEARYYFKFSDRYSIFDWGAMPDALENKGQALAITADLLFREFQKPWQGFSLPDDLPADLRDRLSNSAALKKLQEHGVTHHSLGLVDENYALIGPGNKTSNTLAVVPVDVLKPAHAKVGDKLVWNYALYQDQPQNTIVPLEVIFRFGTPEGSSFLKRGKDAAYLDQLGLHEPPVAGKMLERPIVEFSSKLEPTDRMLSVEEAQAISACSEEEFTNLYDLTLCLAIRFRQICAQMNLELWDGKFEFAFGDRLNEREREIVLIDSIGPDELRLLSDGVQFSKESVRKLYRETPWAKAVEQAKAMAAAEGLVDWKRICKEQLKATPEPLTAKQKEAIEAIYPSFANALAEVFGYKPIFKNVSSVEETCSKLKAIL